MSNARNPFFSAGEVHMRHHQIKQRVACSNKTPLAVNNRENVYMVHLAPKVKCNLFKRTASRLTEGKAKRAPTKHCYVTTDDMRPRPFVRMPQQSSFSQKIIRQPQERASSGTLQIRCEYVPDHCETMPQAEEASSKLSTLRGASTDAGRFILSCLTIHKTSPSMLTSVDSLIDKPAGPANRCSGGQPLTQLRGEFSGNKRLLYPVQGDAARLSE